MHFAYRFFSLNNSFCCQNRKAIVIHDMLFPKPENTNEPHPNSTCLRSSLPKRCAQCGTFALRYRADPVYISGKNTHAVGIEISAPRGCITEVPRMLMCLIGLLIVIISLVGGNSAAIR